jgi:hypothetical protein
MKPLSIGSAVVLLGALSLVGVAAATQAPALRSALTFHAPFDGSVDAAHAAGNAKLHTAPTLARRAEATPGWPATGETVQAKGAGRFGDALKFNVRRKPVVYFEAAGNVAYKPADWSGTVSFWLSVDPATELDPGFCDPIQITPRMWNDAAFFVEFEKTPQAIPFRLGAYADLKVWNPTNRPFAEIPGSERPLVTVDQPPFGKGKWTHVVFSFDRFNTGQPNGVVRLYLDGKPAGQLSPRQQTFTWDPEKSTIAMGLSYVGLFDELSVFNRALTDAEIASLHVLPQGVTGLLSRASTPGHP